jgi:hypothetical protein
MRNIYGNITLREKEKRERNQKETSKEKKRKPTGRAVLDSAADPD